MHSINIRRSIRKFRMKEVEFIKIEHLLRAAMQAPSAGNQLPWEFVVITDKCTLKSLSGVSPYAGLIADAPVVILLIANQSRFIKPAMWQQDMAAATQNLLLESVEQNLGAVWIGVSPLEERVEFVKQTMKLDDERIPFCLIAIGYPEVGYENKFIDRYDVSRISYQ